MQQGSNECNMFCTENTCTFITLARPSKDTGGVAALFKLLVVSWTRYTGFLLRGISELSLTTQSSNEKIALTLFYL